MQDALNFYERTDTFSQRPPINDERAAQKNHLGVFLSPYM